MSNERAREGFQERENGGLPVRGARLAITRNPLVGGSVGSVSIP